MANDLSVLAPKLLAQGLLALRGQNLMPLLVNNDYSMEFAEKGLVVTIPVPSAIAAQDVSPSNTPPSTNDSAPTSALITLNQWKEAPFYLTDKDMQQSDSGIIPMQASEAVKSLADSINAYLMGLYKGVYGYVGTAATTPFATDTTAATNARKLLNRQLAPMGDRRFVMDPDAEANALNLRAFQDASWSMNADAIREGEITRRLGFDWFMDQQVATHTAGTLSNGSTHSALVNGALTAGVTTMNIDSTTLTGTVVTGDVFTFAGHTQTYTVTNSSTLTASGNAIAGVTFSPPLAVNVADNVAVTFKDTHVVNLAFHRDAIGFATRPLLDSGQGLGNIIEAAVDPVTGLALRLEISREHKRTRFSYDILYGASLVRAELATRVAG